MTFQFPTLRQAAAGPSRAPALDYRTFLERKVRMAAPLGFEIGDDEINPIVKPHARAIIRWAIAGGRRAIFAAFGLNKTIIQIEIVRILLAHGGGRGLTVLPLGVRQEFKKDAQLLATGEHPKITEAQRAELRDWLDGRPERAPSLTFIRRIEDAELVDGSGARQPRPGHYLTNYETVRDGKLDPNAFTVATLDEASVLRSFGSLTFQTFLTLFDRVKFRFVATATPSPNRFKELIHYAGFLGVMDTGQALTRFFQRDSEKAGNLTLYPHKEYEFWLWVASWGVFLQKPSDLGFSDDGYALPPLSVYEHEVKVDLTATTPDRDGQGKLFRDSAIGLSDVAREKRDSIGERVAQVIRILADAAHDGQAVVWCDLNDEQMALEKAMQAAGISVTSLYGSQNIDEREEKLAAWKAGRTRVFLSKPSMYGAGVNMQQASVMIFAGLTFKFYELIQAIHRVYRFLQFDIVDRLIERYSAPGELVFDPFGGLFTVPYRAMKLGRRGRAVELNPDYFLDGVKYLEAMEREVGMPTLFDLMAVEESLPQVSPSNPERNVA